MAFGRCTLQHTYTRYRKLATANSSVKRNEYNNHVRDFCETKAVANATKRNFISIVYNKV